MIRWLMSHKVKGHKAYVAAIDSLNDEILLLSDHEDVILLDRSRYQPYEASCEDCALVLPSGAVKPLKIVMR